MLEYVFFHERPHRLFRDYLKAKGLAPEEFIEDDNYEVRLPEDIDDGLSDEIETRYDELLAMNRQLVEDEQAPGAGEYRMAGVVLNLRDGRVSYADIDPDLLGRIMSVLTAQEFGAVVNAIVDAVESPEERSYCERARQAGESKSS